MNKSTYYVIVGIKTTRKQIESVLGEWWQDKNLPCKEGAGLERMTEYVLTYNRAP